MMPPDMNRKTMEVGKADLHPLGDPLGFPLSFKKWVIEYVTQELQLSKLLGFVPKLVYLTGDIPAAGTQQTSGNGFTYTHTNSTGVYVFAFTQQYAVAPMVFAQVTDGSTVVCQLSSKSATGFTITLAATTDRPFNFFAIAVQ